MRKSIILLFFASGCTALIYQITWIRMLRYIFGNTVFAISTVLTVFMAGLAIGGYLIGRWIDRIDRPLSLYGVMEFLIGVFALLILITFDSMKIFYVWVERQYALSYTSFSLIKFLLAFLVLIVPTTLMGGTFPALARYVSESDDRIGKDVSLIYGANILGAVAGCLLTAFLLLHALGIDNTIFLAVAINTLIALWVLLIAISGRERIAGIPPPGSGSKRPTRPIKGDPRINPKNRSRRRLRGWVLFLSAFSGFATLALEVLWTRTFISMLSANVVVFAVILASFLTGLALGSFIISRRIDQIHDLDSFTGVLLLLNGLILIVVTLSLEKIGGIFEYLHLARSTSAVIDDLGIWSHFAVLFVIILIPSIIMGTVFPTLIRIYASSISTLGRKVGKIYAVNTVGAIVGSFVSGFVLIPLVGINQSVCIIGATYALLASIQNLMNRKTTRLVTGLALMAVSLLMIPFTPSPHWYNAGFIRTRIVPDEENLFFKEGVSANVGIIQRDGFKALTVDGIIVAQNSKDDMWDLLLKAHLPMLLHPNPERVLLVGLGGGISLGAVEKHDVKTIDCVELSPEVVDAHTYFAEENDSCWTDNRLNLIINDGRHYLLTTENRYDIISVDPVDPPVSTLYSRDFFTLCRNALEEDGLMLQWVPMFRLSRDHILMILKSFTDIFPNTTVWYDGTSIFLLGRRGEERNFDYDRFLSGYAVPDVQESLEKIDVIDPHLILSTFVAHCETFESALGEGILENSDNNPRLEYSVLLARGHSFYKNLELLLDRHRSIVPFLDGLDEEDDIASIERSCALMKELLGVRIIASEANVIRSRRMLDEAASRLNSVAARFGLNMEDIERLKPFWEPIIN
jgi:spermidine synthase